MKYDIFISYRREGGYDTAKHLYDLLVRDGYKVSFDIDTLRSGDFNVQILERIQQCKDFILIVDEHAFDRTLDATFDPKKDWLRCELAHALKYNKNIIPVFLSGVAGFPDGLPLDIVDVIKKNGPAYNRYYFNDFYETLKKRFLHKRSKYNYFFIVVAVLLIVTLTLFIGNFGKEKPEKVEREEYTDVIIEQDDSELAAKKQIIIDEFERQNELPVSERVDIQDLIETFMFEEACEYIPQSWDVFGEYNRKFQLIPLTDGLESLDGTVHSLRLQFIAKLTCDGKNLDTNVFGQSKIQYISLYGGRYGVYLLVADSGENYRSDPIDNDWITEDLKFTKVTEVEVFPYTYVLYRRDNYWLVLEAFSNSNGDYYKWFVSTDIHWVYDYMQILGERENYVALIENQLSAMPTCEYCDGQGTIEKGDDYVMCSSCSGTGVVY